MDIPLLTTGISKHFSYKEALWLPSWNRAAIESDGLSQEILDNLIILFNKMDSIRDTMGMPIIVHCAYRPPAYNTLVHGAPNSAHLHGMACDFHVSGSTCDAVRQKILNENLLETLEMRMEDAPGTNWVHLDWAPVISNRFFKP
jgi:uncharacterized protein YcbK (DUF882 family)